MANLPLEILSHIFSYVSLSDRLQANLVCKQWHWAFLESKLHDKTVIKFDEDENCLQSLSGSSSGVSLLESEVTTAVRNLTFENISVNIFSVRQLKDWFPVLSRLKRLSLLGADIVSEYELVTLLKNATNLNGLRINSARDCFISGGFLATEEDRDAVRIALSKLTSLDLSSNSPYLTDQLFNRITFCTPNLTEFILDHTKILSHAGIYRKHYPASVTDFDSPSVLTWRNVLRFLADNAGRLNKISFYNSGITATGLKELGQTANLSVQSLNIGRCLDISTDSLLEFCRNQPKLRKLGIDGCRRVLADNTNSRLALFETLSSSLQFLSMKGLSCPRGLEESFQLIDKLTYLDASECDIPSNHLFNGLYNNKGVGNFKVLILNSFGISVSDTFLGVIPNLKHLTTLELRNGHEGVTDIVVQAIIKHCQQIEVLDLSNCGQLTDSAFTQRDTEEIPKSEIENQGKIFLGSRAEAELRSEIKRIEYLTKSADISHPSVVSGLQKLRKLSLENVRLTEMSLKLSFNFEDLRYINLSLCKSIADSGFKALADQNPRLETLIAKQCNITGETLLHLVKKCARLTTLDVEACLQICDESVRKLPQFCANLRFIDLSFCKKVRTSTIENVLMKEISALRSVGMRGLALAELLDESDSDDDHAIDTKPPMPPPFLLRH